MRTLVIGISLIAALAAAQPAFAGNPVDLRGKTGVVDPRDLKQFDPKPPRVERVVPPSPPAAANDKFDVSKSSGSAPSIPPNGGDMPPPRNQTVPERHLLPVLPRPVR